jgi:hypothetical protein
MKPTLNCANGASNTPFLQVLRTNNRALTCRDVLHVEGREFLH